MNWVPAGFQPPGWQPPGWQPEAPGGGGGPPAGGGFRVTGRRPITRRISGRSLVFAVSGPEEPYPVYQFSRRQFFEKPKHNPFKGL